MGTTSSTIGSSADLETFRTGSATNSTNDIINITNNFDISGSFSSSTIKQQLVVNGGDYIITVKNVTDNLFSGLFEILSSMVESITISNLNIIFEGNVNISGAFISSGLLSGSSYTITMSNCSISGEYTIIDGGLIGNNLSFGTISKCYSTGGSTTTTGTGYICGSNCSGIITTCFSDGNITENSGGICGSSFDGTITTSFSIGDIVNGGGIAGQNFTGSISKCYSRGDIVSGGGIIYDSIYSPIISDCYSSGTRTSGGAIAGVITSGSVTNCHGVSASSISDLIDGSVTATLSTFGSFTTFESSGLIEGSWTDTNLISPPSNTDNYILSEFNTSPYEYEYDFLRAIFTGITSPVNTKPMCFMNGTLILTEYGEIKIEKLSIGDKIITSDNRSVSIIKILKTKITKKSNVHPYLIPKNMFGSVPTHDLYLSDTHLINPNGTGWFCPCIYPNIKCTNIYDFTFYNLLLEKYHTDSIIANGIKCDSAHTEEESMFYIDKHFTLFSKKDKLGMFKD